MDENMNLETTEEVTTDEVMDSGENDAETACRVIRSPQTRMGTAGGQPMPGSAKI